eukprot:1527362-Rhodomonas_salina.2
MYVAFSVPYQIGFNSADGRSVCVFEVQDRMGVVFAALDAVADTIFTLDIIMNFFIARKSLRRCCSNGFCIQRLLRDAVSIPIANFGSADWSILPKLTMTFCVCVRLSRLDRIFGWDSALGARERPPEDPADVLERSLCRRRDRADPLAVPGLRVPRRGQRAQAPAPPASHETLPSAPHHPHDPGTRLCASAPHALPDAPDRTPTDSIRLRRARRSSASFRARRLPQRSGPFPWPAFRSSALGVGTRVLLPDAVSVPAMMLGRTACDTGWTGCSERVRSAGASVGLTAGWGWAGSRLGAYGRADHGDAGRHV